MTLTKHKDHSTVFVPAAEMQDLLADKAIELAGGGECSVVAISTAGVLLRIEEKDED